MRLIDADVLPNYKCQVTVTIGESKGPEEMRFVFWKDIEKAPTIDAVPVVHGQWIERPQYDVFGDCCYIDYECSVCHNIACEDAEHYAYCPHCGQPMDAKDMDVPTKDGGATDGSDA